jgi:hypothetical protein
VLSRLLKFYQDGCQHTYCLHTPPLTFNCVYGVFTAKPPWFVTKIYPFLGFDPLLEFPPKSTIPIGTYNVHIACFPENPLMGFVPFQHSRKRKLHWSGDAPPDKNACMVWLPSWHSSLPDPPGHFSCLKCS